MPSQGGDFSLNKEDGKKTALQTHEKPLQNDSRALDEQGEGSSENALVEALSDLFEKTLAETMAEVLENEGKGERMSTCKAYAQVDTHPLVRIITQHFSERQQGK